MARKNYNIDEMRALKLAYDSDITRNDKFRYYVMPAILVIVAVFVVMTPRIALTWQQEVPGVGQPEYIKSDYPTVALQKSGKLDADKFLTFCVSLMVCQKLTANPITYRLRNLKLKRKPTRMPLNQNSSNLIVSLHPAIIESLAIMPIAQLRSFTLRRYLTRFGRLSFKLWLHWY